MGNRLGRTFLRHRCLLNGGECARSQIGRWLNRGCGMGHRLRDWPEFSYGCLALFTFQEMLAEGVGIVMSNVDSAHPAASLWGRFRGWASGGMDTSLVQSGTQCPHAVEHAGFDRAEGDA